MEAEASAAQAREAAEIAAKEKELAQLDAKIQAMRNRLSSSAVKSDDSLDNMLAMVRQKESQKKRLNELRQQREEEEKRRQTEIANLKKKRNMKVIASLEPHIKKYQEIISSEFGRDVQSAAWKSLVAACPPGWPQ